VNDVHRAGFLFEMLAGPGALLGKALEELWHTRCHPQLFAISSRFHLPSGPRQGNHGWSRMSEQHGMSAASSGKPGTSGETIEQEQLVPLYNVVLFDDNQHTYDYVIEMLCRLFVMPPEDAFRHAVEVDTTGRTVVITCELPQAEFARDQIHAYGPDWRMPQSRRSMRAAVEPAGG